MDKELLRQIVAQQKNGLFGNETIKRELLDEISGSFKDNRIIILTGIRRCGKSTLLMQLMETKKKYCYVNFEDERFIDFRAQDFEQLNEVLIEIYGNPETYFFDEIQNIEKFETFVRRLQDQGKKVIITGSNASLLSKELGTRLTGRYKAFGVYPFSFSEFLAFKKIVPEKNWFFLAEKKVKLTSLFNEYLLEGGLPEYLKYKDTNYVKTVFENILYRDIIARYSIRRQKLVKELVNILATNVSLLFTYNALKKSLGLSNAITVKEYLSYLENSFLFFEMQKFDFSVRKQLNAPKKVFLADSAFHKISGANFSPDKGRLLENLVFIELKRRGEETFYYAGNNECDFLVKNGTKIKEAIQACYVLNKENRERELNGLTEAMQKFKLKQGLILTFEQEEEIKIKNKKIKIIPTFKWLLENKKG
jgi:predicted AAA+ superfamily ATPase